MEKGKEKNLDSYAYLRDQRREHGKGFREILGHFLPSGKQTDWKRP